MPQTALLIKKENGDVFAAGRGTGSLTKADDGKVAVAPIGKGHVIDHNAAGRIQLLAYAFTGSTREAGWDI